MARQVRNGLWIISLIAACTPTGADSKPGDSEQDSGLDASTPDDSEHSDVDTEQADRPIVTSADAYCYFHETGEQFWAWDTNCAATDPQGTDTLARGGTMEARLGVSVLATYAMACDPDTGRCSSTFREDTDQILCSNATSYTFYFVVMDEDDHVSDAFEVNGHPQ